MLNRCFRIVMLLLVCLGFCLGIQADNIIHIGNASGSPGEEAKVSVALTNSDAVSAMQLQVTMPEGISLVDGSAELASRATDHSATVGVKDGVLNIMVYSMNMTALSGNEGDVVSFRVRLGNQPGQFALSAQEVILTGANGNVLGASAVNGSVAIVAPKAQYNSMTVDFGHVPIRDTYTKTVTVSNVGNAPLTVEGLVFSDGAFSSTTTFPLTIDAGGNATVNITYAPTERGAIEETMKVVCNSISKLNTIKLTADPFAVNELHVQNASGIADETVTLNLMMNNMDDITGFQWEFNLPSQLEYVDGSFQLSDRKADHTFVTTLKDGVLRVVCYSITDTPFTGSDGDIASFDVIIRGRNNVTVTPVKAVLSAMVKGKVTDVLSAKYGGTVTVRSPRLNTGISISMGATPVTSNAEKTFTVRNQGSAPLTISRVVFNQDHLSLKESATLPIVIECNKTVTLTVVYDGTEEVSYESYMQIYSNDPEQRVYSVKVLGSRFAPNYLSFAAEDTYTVDDVLAVNVNLNNYDPINGLQFDVTYTPEWYEPTDGFTTTTRAEGLTLNWRKISDNTVRYFVYSLSDAIIESGEGQILSIPFTQKSGVTEGQYQMSVTNIVLGTANLTDKFSGTDQSFSFNVKSYLAGDVNGDGVVSITDAVTIVYHINGIDVPNFIDAAADVNKDNSISITDAVSVVYIINGLYTASAKSLGGTTEPGPSYLTLSQKERNALSVGLMNSSEYTAFQMDVKLPETMNVENVVLNKERMGAHSVYFNRTDERTVRISCFSPRGECISNSMGEILQLVLSGNGSGEVSIDNILFTTTSLDEHELSPLSTMATAISGVNAANSIRIEGNALIISSDVEKDLNIYTLSGQLYKHVHLSVGTNRIEGIQRGVYLINGMKISFK